MQYLLDGLMNEWLIGEACQQRRWPAPFLPSHHSGSHREWCRLPHKVFAMGRWCRAGSDVLVGQARGHAGWQDHPKHPSGNQRGKSNGAVRTQGALESQGRGNRFIQEGSCACHGAGLELGHLSLWLGSTYYLAAEPEN